MLAPGAFEENAPKPLVQFLTMSDYDYRSARAMYPFRPDLWVQAQYIYDPLPLRIQVPSDHPELPLFSDIHSTAPAIQINHRSANIA